MVTGLSASGTDLGPGGDGLHEAVARTADAHPERTALVTGERRISYAELDAAADCWAADLAEHGVCPGTHVPIMLPRSADLVIALLAVLKAGGVYALLDPHWPRAQLESVLCDLETDLVIDLSDAVPPPNYRLWSPPEIGTVSATPEFVPVTARGEDPCCVFFTSGTTGRPKGVVVTHRSTARLFVQNTFARFDSDTVIPLAAAPPWDAFSLELWGGLLNGGTCVVVEEPFLSSTTLRSGIAAHSVNTAWITSSLFNMLVDESLDAFDGLRQVLVGGERLSTSHVRRFLKRHPTVTLFNGYGPVESTVFASAHRIMPADCSRPGGIPLGICVPGTSVYVLDGDRECGRDEEGEICVTGDGLAIGYLGDPELTAHKFTTVKLAGRRQRVYHTGDLGVWGSPDGLLEFRGRADRQLKIRGHRVEPADIESRIETLAPRVASCRVVPRRDQLDSTHELVAFCIPRVAGDELSGLLEDLTPHLATYQQPVQVVSVPTFPLSSRGKIDEAALLDQGEVGLDSPATAAAQVPNGDTAATADETLVSEAFASVLGYTGFVPRDASFFELGGSSLGAGRVCARLDASSGLAVPVSQLYQHPTVAQLGAWLGQTTLDKGSFSVPGDAVPLTPSQVVFLTRDLVDPDGLTNHCLLVWRLAGQLDFDSLDRAVIDVHERHQALRASYTFDPAPNAQVTEIEAPELHVLAPEPTPETALRALRIALSVPFDVEGGDVWRASLVPVGSGSVSLFGCSVHHIAFDGWSESVLSRDLSRAYNGGSVSARSTSLHQIARHRARRQQHADIAGQVTRLAAELRGVPEIVWPASLTRDRSVAAVRTLTASVPVTDIARIDSLAAQYATTRFVVLLTSWGRALASVTGSTDFAVGVPVSDRSHLAEDDVVGCHLSMVPMRLSAAAVRPGPDGRDNVAAALEATVRMTRLAFSCQDAPFDDVVQALMRQGNSRSPIFQTLFALQDNPGPLLEFDGLETTHLRQPYLELPTELHLELWPEPGGDLTVQLSFRPADVAESVAVDLLDSFMASQGSLLQESSS
jgi:amino acid adenylation domain-containing protein